MKQQKVNGGYIITNGRNQGKSNKFNQLMDVQKISDEICFHKTQKDKLINNYNILQDYYDQQLQSLNHTMVSLRDDDNMKEHIEVQLFEVKDESDKQFEFINIEINKHNLFITYWEHRLKVITIKEMYGKEYEFYLHDKLDLNGLPLFTFNNAFEFQEWLTNNKENISNISLDIRMKS